MSIGPSQGDDGAGLGVFSVLLGGAIALVVVTIIALLGLVVVGGMAESMGTEGDPFNTSSSADPVTGQAVSFENTQGEREVLEVYSVQDSRGNAVRLTGADDSYVQSQESVDLASGDNWTVATWARVRDGQGAASMTAVSADGEVLIQYNGSRSEWSAWYYDEGARNSYRANVSAPDQPGNLTLVTATANSTHFWIYANQTRGETVKITGSNIVDADVSSGNWNGTLDETRTFNGTTNDSEQADLHNNPVAPRPSRDRTARLMYDEGQGDTTAIFFTGTRADLSNFSWVDGLDGHELTEGTDYEIDTSAGTITALDGGKIDGAPVVWIDYRYQPLNPVGKVSEAIQPAFQLLGTSVIVIPAAAILAVLVGGLIGAITLVGGVSLEGMPGFNDRGGR